MKNNLRGLIIHFFVIIIIYMLAFLINLSSLIRGFLYGNIITRFFIAIIPFILYYNFSKLMSKRKSKNLDFFAGNIITLISILFLAIGAVFLGIDMFSQSTGYPLVRFPIDLFLMPIIFTYTLIGIRLNIITVLLGSLLPTIIYGISIKKSRAQIRRKMARRNMKRR